MTTYDVLVETRARDDLADRYRHLLRTASPSAADAWLDEMADAMNSLASLPDRCPLAPEDDAFPGTIRQLLRARHRILFTVSEETATVHVLHIRHQARGRWAR
ncbi:MAG: type II toxin-antitoxin system RelE/ParE family toxin [Gemmatimonadota bacterium]